MKLIQEGPRDAKVMWVGEAPGANEEKEGRPFIGGSGMIANRMMESAGISRSDCFVTNVCHVRPPSNDFDWFFKKDNQHHLLAGIIQLKKDILEIKPNLVIALGGQSLRVLTGKVGIDSWRGSILESTLVKGQKVIGTYHPAYILRMWDYKAVSEFDMRRCAVEAKTPDITLPEYEFYLDPPADIRTGIAREMYESDWLAVDIECWQRPEGGWNLACVGFSDRGNRALVIPVRGPADTELIRWLLSSPNRKVFQNGTFDVSVLRAEGIEVNNFVWDTMLGHHALFAECAGGQDEMSAHSGKKKQAAIKKGLAFQCSIYTRQPFYKDDGKLWRETNDLMMFWKYNALDVANTRLIRDVQEKELMEYGTMRVLNHEMSLVDPLMAMTKRGIKIDLVVREQMHRKLQGEIERLQLFVDAGAGTEINVKSSKDMLWLLYEKLGLPVKRNKESGNPTADKDAINALAGKSNSPLLHGVLRIREKRDMIERYLNAAISSDGRMRCSFDITGTRSGRLSSRASLDGSGTNLQTIPASMRRMFISDKGKAFVYRDFSQAEARVVAYLARSTGLIELFEDPTRDVHKENAARIFGKAISSITYEERYLAKRVVHACNYGMEAHRLVEVVNEDSETTGVRIDERQARHVIDKYFMMYPELKETFWGDVKRNLKQSLTLNTPFGRKRTFFSRWDDKLIREAYSYIPQSTVGDLCCMALVQCYHEIELEHPEWGAELLLNVHDSILMQCNEEHVREVADAMAKCMDIPITINGYTFKIPTDCHVGKNWGAEDKTNPDGLKEFE